MSGLLDDLFQEALTEKQKTFCNAISKYLSEN